MYHDVHELNFSKIKTYLECPLLYKYKYMDGRKEGLVPAPQNQREFALFLPSFARRMFSG